MAVEIAVIGAGGIGSVHLKTLEPIESADVVAICDVSKEVAKSAAKAFDAAVYTDHEILLVEEYVDALIVAIPPFAHTNQEILAAEQGIDLFVEKPIAITRETAYEIDEAIAESSVISQVGHMYRYHDIVEKAQEIIGDRDIALMDGHWIGGVPPTDWWGIKEKSGGQVVEQAAHLFDLIRYFGGEVDQICAAGGKQVVQDEIDFEDAVSATMKHESGLTSHVSTSCAASEESVSLRIVGDGLSLNLDFVVKSNDETIRAVGNLTGVVDGEQVEYTTDRSAWTTELETFIQAVEQGDESLLRSSYADARKTLELTLAVNEALENDNPIPLQH